MDRCQQRWEASATERCSRQKAGRHPAVARTFPQHPTAEPTHHVPALLHLLPQLLRLPARLGLLRLLRLPLCYALAGGQDGGCRHGRRGSCRLLLRRRRRLSSLFAAAFHDLRKSLGKGGGLGPLQEAPALLLLLARPALIIIAPAAALLTAAAAVVFAPLLSSAAQALHIVILAIVCTRAGAAGRARHKRALRGSSAILEALHAHAA